MRALHVLPALSGLTAAWLLAGCAATASPNTDTTMGDAVRVMRAQQLIDASAAQRHGATVTTTEGRTVRGAVDSLREASKNPAPSTVINVGGGSSGQ
ncbi:hypothetical protein [Ideonella sp.]|uniref:hypothetical protein n=1 Tax=Ideonella sp. TaxID=1929293 RepID=UPI002B48C966|nr:hypothetical protein [Ideonella sp.]HJV69441.1 hypothetical protein [Ideonella sp.]